MAEFLTLKDIVPEIDAQLVDIDCKLRTASSLATKCRILHVVPVKPVSLNDKRP